VVVPDLKLDSHALLTRPPLSPKRPFDLHVLSIPPAFILSQDQTLHFVELSLSFRILLSLSEILYNLWLYFEFSQKTFLTRIGFFLSFQSICFSRFGCCGFISPQHLSNISTIFGLVKGLSHLFLGNFGKGKRSPIERYVLPPVMPIIQVLTTN
jgi:hypothetical protein